MCHILNNFQTINSCENLVYSISTFHNMSRYQTQSFYFFLGVTFLSLVEVKFPTFSIFTLDKNGLKPIVFLYLTFALYLETLILSPFKFSTKLACTFSPVIKGFPIFITPSETKSKTLSNDTFSFSSESLSISITSPSDTLYCFPPD